MSFARKKRAETASGEIVTFIDDDGVAEVDCITEHEKMYEETDAAVVHRKIIAGEKMAKSATT